MAAAIAEEQATLEDWRITYRVNVEGVFLGTKHAQ